VVAFFLYGSIYAQPPTFGQWPISPSTGGGNSSHPTISDESAVDAQLQSVPRQPVSSTVTIHGLQHHVPARAEKEFERGLKAEKKRNDEEAIAHFKKAIVLDPEFYTAINDLGTSYLRLDRVELAVEQFTKAIAVDSHAIVAYSNLALAYLKQGRFADGERTARRAVDLDRGDALSQLMLGTSLVLERHFTAEAERSLTRAAGELAVAKFWLAVGLAEKGDIRNAKDQLNMYLAHAEEPAAHIARAVMDQIDAAR